MDRTFNEHNQNLAGILTNSWEQQSSHFVENGPPKIPSIDSLPALFFCGPEQQLKAHEQRQRSLKDLGQIVKNSCQAITFMKTCKMSVKYFCNEEKPSSTWWSLLQFLSLQPYNEVLCSYISPFNEIAIIDICNWQG